MERLEDGNVELHTSFDIPVDIGRKLDVRKMFRRRPGRLLNVLFTFNLRPVSIAHVFFESGVYC